MRIATLACFLPFVLAASPVLAGNAEAGADAFDSYCSDCHSLSPKALNRKGPSLVHVIGRKAGTVPGFVYSPQMVHSGIVWDARTLDAYLTNPKAVVPEGIMKFKGLGKATERQDIIAYLAAPPE